MKQFTTSTVSTSLVTSTENISLATFPKVVICNKYKLRQVICLFSMYYCLIKHYFLSFAISNCIQIFSIMLHFPRQSFVDSMIDSAVNSSMLEEANLTKEDVVLAMYKAIVTGWGYEESERQVFVNVLCTTECGITY